MYFILGGISGTSCELPDDGAIAPKCVGVLVNYTIMFIKCAIGWFNK
jgi:hypothetical protein